MLYILNRYNIYVYIFLIYKGEKKYNTSGIFQGKKSTLTDNFIYISSELCEHQSCQVSKFPSINYRLFRLYVLMIKLTYTKCIDIKSDIDDIQNIILFFAKIF